MFRLLGINARGQAILAGFCQFADHALDPFSRFALAKDDLRETAALPAMEIDMGKAQVGHGRIAKALQDGIDGYPARTVFFKRVTEFGAVHSLVSYDRNTPK